MCCWMGSHFHDWIDYNGVAFSIQLLEWGHTFSEFGGLDSSSHLRLANVPECLSVGKNFKCSSFRLKNGSTHKKRKWLSWDRKNYIFAQKLLRWVFFICHRIDYNGVGALRGQRHIHSKNLPKYHPPPLPGVVYNDSWPSIETKQDVW